MNIINRTLNNKKNTPDARWEWIKFNLRLRGCSLSKLSKELGVTDTAIKNASYRPYPKMERIIAEKIGVKPQDIWPERYDSDGKPNRINPWYLRGSKKVSVDHTKREPKSNGKKRGKIKHEEPLDQ